MYIRNGLVALPIKKNKNHGAPETPNKIKLRMEGNVSNLLCHWFLKTVEEPEGVHETFAFDLHLGGSLIEALEKKNLFAMPHPMHSVKNQ